MVNLLLTAILEALRKRKRRLLDGMETLPPEMFMVQRKRLLRELGNDEFEKDLRKIIEQYSDRQGKGK